MQSNTKRKNIAVRMRIIIFKIRPVAKRYGLLQITLLLIFFLSVRYSTPHQSNTIRLNISIINKGTKKNISQAREENWGSLPIVLS